MHKLNLLFNSLFGPGVRVTSPPETNKNAEPGESKENIS